ncbi:MAG TPA: type II toxin-antitoxin system prevent-host-death family antitoxin [Thermoanaerobaculia bacterium]|nr:type II toxin-antitoxin system prevent-host-death family antitoxin [Thermoanaerobaculia bacterium]
MDWKIAEAKQRFSEVVRAAEDEPQRIYNRDQLVAAVVGAAEIKEFLEWRERQRKGSLADSIRELSRICAEEGYTLEVPRRVQQGRSNPFAEDLDVPL